MFNPNYFFNLFVLLNEQWLAISHSFCVSKNIRGRDNPQQAGASATLVASKANACQTT
jgi:hypothetical protein